MAMEKRAPTPSSERRPEPGAARAAHASTRIAPWDTLRVLAFLDVASYHLNDQHALLGVGLPTFLVLALGLGARRPVPQPTAEFLRVRVRRLLVPWLAWTAIYGAWVALRAVRHGMPLGQVFDPGMLLYGTEQHLWFLPFATAAGVATNLLDRLTHPLRSAWLVPACLAVAGVLLAFQGPSELAYPLPQWVFGLPSIFLGLALGRLLASGGPEARNGWRLVLVVSLVLLAALLVGSGFRVPTTPVAAFRYALVMALLAAGALLPRLGDPWTPRLEALLLGAYLIHPLVQNLAMEPAYRLAGLHPGAIAKLLLNSIVTFALVAALRRTPARAIV